VWTCFIVAWWRRPSRTVPGAEISGALLYPTNLCHTGLREFEGKLAAACSCANSLAVPGRTLPPAPETSFEFRRHRRTVFCSVPLNGMGPYEAWAHIVADEARHEVVSFPKLSSGDPSTPFPGQAKSVKTL
jgi:hypothetical protein